MAVKRTIIEEGEPADQHVVNTTKVVTDPDIHTPIVEERHVVTDSPSVSTVSQTKVVREPLVKADHPQKVYETKKSILKTSEIIWAVLLFIELLLVFRVALKILGADPTSGFATLIYAISYPLALPFFGILRTDYSGATGSVFEWSTIVAAIVYAVIAFGLIYLISLARPVTPEEVESRV